MNTAKQNFEQFVYTKQTMMEVTKQQCEQKMATLQSCKISYAFFWTLFWWVMGPLGFIFSLFFNISNYSKRTNFKDVELMRIQMKINQFLKYEVPQQQSQPQPQQSPQSKKIPQPLQTSSTQQPLQQQQQQQQPSFGDQQLNQDNIQQQKEVTIPMPMKRQLDFNNLAKEKILQILEVSHITCSSSENISQLSEKINSNEISWNKLSEVLLKEILDVNGITYKLRITKADMINLLK